MLVQWLITLGIVLVALWLAVRKMAPAGLGGAPQASGCSGCAQGCKGESSLAQRDFAGPSPCASASVVAMPVSARKPDSKEA